MYYIYYHLISMDSIVPKILKAGLEGYQRIEKQSDTN